MAKKTLNQANLLKIMTLALLVAFSIPKKLKFTNGLYTIDRRRLIYLTKFHFYGRGRIVLRSYLSKDTGSAGKIEGVKFLLFKQSIWDNLDKNLSCKEQYMYSFRNFAVDIPLNGKALR